MRVLKTVGRVALLSLSLAVKVWGVGTMVNNERLRKTEVG